MKGGREEGRKGKEGKRGRKESRCRRQKRVIAVEKTTRWKGTNSTKLDLIQANLGDFA